MYIAIDSKKTRHDYQNFYIKWRWLMLLTNDESVYMKLVMLGSTNGIHT